MLDLSTVHIGIIGLGYVGLPLAVEFGKHYPTLGFDISKPRIQALENGHDASLECSSEELKQATKLQYTTKPQNLAICNVYIITVPTPIDQHKRPDLTPLIKASETVAKVINKNDIVIYESTVYPGATEEVCIPVIEQISKLKFNQDFFAGYSPERINPGDPKNRLTTIVKVTSGSTPDITDFVDELYRSIITVGTHKASSIRVAEAAKVIENTQRDVNIALINELAILFHQLGIDTEEILQAAGSKWNFLPFRPGLVGGHCIGVDPYYLTHKAQEIGHHPEMILAGRRTNDQMGQYIVNRLLKAMIQHRITLCQANILILGLTFKENCPDLRNTRVVDIIEELHDYPVTVDIYDPWASAVEAKQEYNVELLPDIPKNHYDAILLAVGHRQFKEMGIEQIRSFGKEKAVVFDVKYIFPADKVDARL